MAHRNGFDVFMGNFRGVSPRKLADWKQESSESYWDYKIDDMAKHDVAAFIKKIFALKVNEIMIQMQNYAVKRGSSIKRMGLTNSQLKDEIRAKIKLTFVGHSLGGVVLPIYLLHCKTNDLEHSVAQAVLISPEKCRIWDSVTRSMRCIVFLFIKRAQKLLDKLALPRWMISAKDRNLSRI